MEVCEFFVLVFAIFSFIQVSNSKFTSNVCNHDKPHIHFPYKLNSFCKNNQTLVNFQRYGDLGVKSVSFDHKKLTLFDPKDCVFEVFLNLDLSLTPFKYYHVVKDYTYLNCSVELSGRFEEIPCLSGLNHHVYVEEAALAVPGCCEVVKNVSIPFSYSSYVSDDSFGLDLTWDSTTGFPAQDKSRWFGFQSIEQELSIAVLVLVVVGLAFAKAYCSKKSESKEHEWEMLLGDLEMEHSTRSQMIERELNI